MYIMGQPPSSEYTATTNWNCPKSRAKEAIKKGFAVDTVADITELPIEEVQLIADGLSNKSS
jgi:hypothetical protein